MVQAVNNAAVSPQAERSDAGAVRALVDVIKNEEVAIVVNLDDRIQVYMTAYSCVLWSRCMACVHVQGHVAQRDACDMLSRSGAG